ncbi:MAG TPA: M20/M25/M40 family metallo-hydrolase [Candidatus Sulfotelmatobacter sp.]|nr:M20/M25/M40 family metallo-hydrolase [Candidatus Sulfotelmatobacter sp.]
MAVSALLFAAGTLLWSQANPASGSIPSMAARLSMLRESASKTDALPEIEELSDRIGPRLTGSDALRKASQYVLRRMREIGLSHVHSESWTLPRGWQRGHAEASLVEPFALSVPVAAYGWTGLTPRRNGPSPLVLLNADEVAQDLDRLVRSQGTSWGGKILLVSANSSTPMRAYSQLLPLVRAATAAHAVAVLRHDTRPGAGIVHSEPVSVVLPANVDSGRVPALDIPNEAEKMIERLLRSGRHVSMRLSVVNHFSSAPVDCDNIVGEIEGISHPEQVVIVGAHLDSWDLGTGATDDGFGVAAVLGAAQALIRSGLHPLRTIRFVLFSGEEQGLLGSTAYVHAHSAELYRTVAALALDWGAGSIVKLPVAGHSELIPLLQQLNTLVPALGLEAPDDGWLFMTDAYAFSLAGVPGIAPLIRSAGYLEQAHSSEDTLDKVNPSDLQQAMTVLTLASFLLADSEAIPPTYFTPQQTRSSLIQGKQQKMLEVFGIWPF